MTIVDIIVLIIVFLIVSAIVFFAFIFPRLGGKKPSACSSCPVVKNAKRLSKDYKREHQDKK